MRHICHKYIVSPFDSPLRFSPYIVSIAKTGKKSSAPIIVSR